MRRAALLLAALAVGPAPADDAEAFRDEYEPHWRGLTAHLWRNVKLAGVAEVRQAPLNLDLFRGTLRFEAVADDHTLVWLGHYEPKGLPPPTLNLKFTEPFPPFDQLVVIRPDGVATFQSSPPGVGWFRKHYAVSPWGSRTKHWLYHSHYADTQLAWPLWAADIRRGPNAYYDPLRKDRLLSPVPTRRDVGYQQTRDAVVVVTNGGTRQGERTTLSQPDHLVRERLFAPGVATVERFDAYRGYTVSYSPAPPGELPFPSAVTGWERHVERGTRLPVEEVTFTEYRRYIPTPAELDVGKRFGVRLPAFGPRPPLPPLGTYLDDPSDPNLRTLRPPQTPPPPTALPEADNRRLRLNLLVALAVAAGVAAVIWRRRA